MFHFCILTKYQEILVANQLRLAMYTTNSTTDEYR